MSLSLRWVGLEEAEAIIQTRLRCYGASPAERGRFAESLTCQERATDGDFLLADRDGQSVGTATSLSLRLYVRGAALPCQGVAYVGTIKTERRKRDPHGGAGIATAVMRATLEKARERGQVVSALMPFRASFYEHFGYGLVEERADWTIPLAVLPTGDTSGLRYCEPSDRDPLVACRERMAQRGQCDILSPPGCIGFRLAHDAESWFIVDRPDASGPVRGYVIFRQDPANQNVLRVVEQAYDDAPALLRQLHFFASLRDQHSTLVLPAPADLPLNLLLKETQVPHRIVPHAAAEARLYTRMQIRILDHIRFLQSLPIDPRFAGALRLGIREPEGEETRLELDFHDGRIAARNTSSEPHAHTTAATWAALATGALRAPAALELNLLRLASPEGAHLLDAFAQGPQPFCRDYF